MPGAKVFIDANVLLYVRDRLNPAKAEAALGWLRQLGALNCGRTNLQVLNEVTNVLLLKRRDMTASQIFGEVDGLRPFGSTPLTEGAAFAARSIRLSTRYSWWDCLLLASALDIGCTHFLSEDMQDGQVVSDGSRALTIVDPFAHSHGHILS